MLKRFQLDLLVAGLLLLLPLILFWPVTAGDRTLIPADALTAVEPYRSAAAQFNLAGPPQNALLQDLVLENYLWKKFILESIQARELPLWNPYIFSGVPLNKVCGCGPRRLTRAFVRTRAMSSASQ